MIRWHTYYRIYGKGPYNQYVWAETLWEAKKLCRLRGLGEEPTGYEWPHGEEPSVYDDIVHVRADKPLQQIHALCFLGMLATASGVSGPCEFLGDQGLVHAWTHLQIGLLDDWEAREVREAVLNSVKRIEALIPGHLNPETGRRGKERLSLADV